MRAVVIHAPKDLRIEQFDDVVLAPGQVRVRVEAAGICGSDLHYYHHGGFGAVRIRQPMILGHEVAGIVEEMGRDVAGLSIGDRVAVNPSLPCDACEYCLRGEHIHCLNMLFYGSAMRMPHVDGAFRDILVAEARQCVKVPAEMPASAAAMAEPLSVCLHAANRAGDLLGKRVLITGSGPIGTLCALVARRAGAAEIVATDVAPEPLAFMRAAGADVALDTAHAPQALAPYAAGKGTFDVHFEASGNATALVGALDALRPGATIVQVGIGGNAELPLNILVAKEFALKGTFRFYREFQAAVDLMASGLIDVMQLLTATFGVDDAEVAFETATDRSRSMKVQLAFG